MRPTIANLEAEVRRLKSNAQAAGDALTDLYENATYSEKNTIEEIASILGVSLDIEREINVTITISGTVRCPVNVDPNDLTYTINGREVSCGDLEIEGYDSDISFEIVEAYWE